MLACTARQIMTTTIYPSSSAQPSLRIFEWSTSKPFIHIKPSREAFDIQNRLIGKIPDKSFINYRWCDEPINSFHHRTWNPYNLKTLERHLPKIGAVLCDNQFIKERDQQYFGIELSSWHVVRAHVDTSNAHSHQSIPTGAVQETGCGQGGLQNKETGTISRNSEKSSQVITGFARRCIHTGPSVPGSSQNTAIDKELYAQDSI